MLNVAEVINIGEPQCLGQATAAIYSSRFVRVQVQNPDIPKRIPEPCPGHRQRHRPSHLSSITQTCLSRRKNTFPIREGKTQLDSARNEPMRCMQPDTNGRLLGFMNSTLCLRRFPGKTWTSPKASQAPRPCEHPRKRASPTASSQNENHCFWFFQGVCAKRKVLTNVPKTRISVVWRRLACTESQAG